MQKEEPKMSKNGKKGCSGCFKIIVIPIILIIFCIAVSNGLFDGNTTTSKGEIETQPVNTEMYRLYSQLNSDEKKIYEAAVVALDSGETKFTIEGFNYATDKETAFKAITALKDDHPEYFWLNNITYVSGTLTGDSMTVEVDCYDYWKYTTNPKKYTDPVWAKVNEIVAQANTYPTVYEKVVFVHDYLVKNVMYDHDALEDEKLTKNPASAYHIRSAYGCLVTGKAVCAGYAKAFQLIMQQLGIPCYYITGDAGGPHAWNSVELDGAEYLMDVTWDDPDNNKYPYESTYDYFCTTSSLFDKTHEADEDFVLPSDDERIETFWE